ncbi:MAG: hypothetical protein JO119_21310, partial [Acidobacteria bacterium]|nr:hypothetical protein [Acidobacteriota bacterium]
LLISKVPIATATTSAPQKKVQSIALDRSSRSTQALTKILCARHWQIAPKFNEMSPDLAAMLAENDAALLIGDPALRISLAVESSAFVGAGFTPPALSSTSVPPPDQPTSPSRPGSARLLRAARGDPKSTPAGGFEVRSDSAHSAAQQPSASSTSAAPEITDAATLGLSGNEKLYVYDIVEQWRCMTNLSAVLAVWAARPNVATPDVVADFHASRAFGLLHLHELCDAASAELRLPSSALHSYLTNNIDFTLDPENRSALSQFFSHAAALNLTPHAKPVLLATGPNRLVLESAVAKLR